MTGAENPPDGVETVYEWREGNHKCIERRAGPGEDVEVEVIRNAYKGVPKPCHQKLAAKWEDLRMMLTPVREKPKDASELKPTK